MKKVCVLMIGILMVIALFAGCTKAEPMTNDKADSSNSIVGEIKEISFNDSSVSILVEKTIEDDIMYDKAIVMVDNKTKVIIDDNSGIAEDLKEGMTVYIVFDGPVRESDPVQADAKSVIANTN